MTKKGFNKLAVALASVRPSLENPGIQPQTAKRTYVSSMHAWARSVAAVADVCAESNPRFDRDRFISACHNWDTGIRDGKLVKIGG